MNRLARAAALLLCGGGCGRSDAEPPGPAERPPAPTPAAAQAASPAPSGNRASGLAATSAPAARPIAFADATTESGISIRTVCGDEAKTFIVESLGTGVAFFDADGDGDQDLFHGNGAPLTAPADPSAAPRPAFYLNDGKGRFRDVAAEAGLAASGAWHGTSAADYDGDGRPDLFVTSWGRAALYRNLGVEGGVPRFAAVGAPARVDAPGWSTSAAFADLDRDGDLDLYVCHYITFDPKTAPRDCPWKGRKAYCGPEGLTPERDALFRNEGDGTFSEALAAWGYDPGEAFYALGVVVADLDGDGDPDTYVANDSQRNLLFRNLGDGRAEEVGVPSGVAYGDEGQEQASMGVDAGDFDGDGRADLFVTNFEGDYYTLYRNEGEQVFADVTIPAGLERPTWSYLGWGTRFFDYDHDGDEDLFAANGHVYPLADEVPGLSYRQRNQLYRNDGGKFAVAAAGPGWEVVESSRGAAVADLDEDGDLDLVFTNLDARSTVLRNDGASEAPWIRLLAVGRRSEREAVGAIFLLEAGGRRQAREARATTGYLSTHDARVHFGLGLAEQADRVVVRWPSGREDAFGPLPARRTYRIEEGGAPQPVAPRGGG